ncbi:MAG: hypothetical protein APF84_16410 [Gracilibacter sp. BRH_c7a]|nr:MAG: hypothetical protein APF84_16410 [Gracilibacter sp. BRH_c7a]
MEIQWTLVLFTLLTGMGAGIFAFVSVAEILGKMEKIRPTGALFALGLIIVGGLASVFHLSHPTRAINVLGNLNTAFGREFVLLGIVVVLIASYIMVIKRDASPSIKKAVSIAGLLSSVILAFEIGATYVLPAQPAWNTYLLPLVYLASAGVLGIFGIYVIVSRKESEHEQEQGLIGGINTIALGAIVTQAVLVFTYISHLGTSMYTDISVLTTSTGLMMFWLGVFAVGLLIPFILTLWFKKSGKNALNIAAISLACSLIGGIAFRAMMYTLGSGYNLNI